MKYLFCCFLLLFLPACNSNADPDKEKKIILAMLQTERKAHFERNTELFISEFADSMISVNKGIVSVPSNREHNERVGNHFGRVQFVKWDDTAEPIIRFSDDASLAYAIIQKEVILTYPDHTGKILYDTAQYAWASIYRKYKNEWKMECNISTNK